jgi:NAD(P)-dependent dehydrogenase (short-subunit alcohol dehydrogenase family)
MAMEMSGKHALVTGASRGVGAAVAEVLAEQGAHVICHARSEEAAREAATRVGGSAVWGEFDGLDGVRQVAAQTRALVTELHALVHVAAVLLTGTIDDVTPEALDSSFAVNVVAPVLLTQALLEPLRAGQARIVVVSSTEGQLARGMPGGWLPYRISKTAVHAFVSNAAADLASDGCIVNAVHPGWVKTDMGGGSAVLDPREAGENVAWLASFPAGGPTGRFYFERREIPW